MFSEKRVSALPVVDESGMICFLCSLLKISFLRKVKLRKQRQAEVKNFLKKSDAKFFEKHLFSVVILWYCN